MKRRCYITGKRLAIKGMVPLMTYQGEDIEVKVKRITENNEPIKDGAPITYTEKKDGVRPEFDIRTDKWELVQEKMEAGNIQKMKIAKGIVKPETSQEKTAQAAETSKEAPGT